MLKLVCNISEIIGDLKSVCLFLSPKEVFTAYAFFFSQGSFVCFLLTLKSVYCAPYTGEETRIRRSHPQFLWIQRTLSWKMT